MSVRRMVLARNQVILESLRTNPILKAVVASTVRHKNTNRNDILAAHFNNDQVFVSAWGVISANVISAILHRYCLCPRPEPANEPVAAPAQISSDYHLSLSQRLGIPLHRAKAFSVVREDAA